MHVDKLWWYPPQPVLVSTHAPKVDRYFSHRHLLWMPRKLWKVRLICPNESCKDHELTGAGVYKRVRQVLDVDSYYLLATEYLECSSCKKKYMSWGQPILRQLSIEQQLQFLIILTYHHACDMKVIRLLRQRGLGNSTNQLRNKLDEQHSKAWMQRTMHYLAEAKAFIAAKSRGLLQDIQFVEPRPMKPVPGAKWLLHIYARDVMTSIPYSKQCVYHISRNMRYKYPEHMWLRKYIVQRNLVKRFTMRLKLISSAPKHHRYSLKNSWFLVSQCSVLPLCGTFWQVYDSSTKNSHPGI